MREGRKEIMFVKIVSGKKNVKINYNGRTERGV